MDRLEPYLDYTLKQKNEIWYLWNLSLKQNESGANVVSFAPFQKALMEDVKS